MPSTSEQTRLILHTYFRSSCSARIRIACHLKNVPVEYNYINLLKNEQTSPDYLNTNPSGVVPTLTIYRATPSPNGHQNGTANKEEVVKITQSLCILEFLEEYFPKSTSLLPPPNQPFLRAKVRELVNIIACDIQPPTNLRILNKAASISTSYSSNHTKEEQEERATETKKAWAKDLMEKGLLAYDILARDCAGKYSVGDQITMADVCLAPAVENAVRWGVDVSNLGSGTVWRVWESLKVEKAFVDGGWRKQGDTPEALRS